MNIISARLKCIKNDILKNKTMKHILITLLVIIVGGISDVLAQPFSEGCQWSYCMKKRHIHDITYTFYKYEFKGIHEVNGKTYLNLYRTNSDEAGNTEEPVYEIGLREENGRVYVNYYEFLEYIGIVQELAEEFPYDYDLYVPYVRTADDELILYDFNVDEGDAVGRANVSSPAYVKSKNLLMMANGEERDFINVWKRIEKSTDINLQGQHYGWDNIISGIGSTQCLVPWLSVLDMEIAEVHDWLNVYVENNKLVYKSDEYRDDPFFGDVVSGINTVKTAGDKIEDAVYYDLSGRRIAGAPRSGIYIKGGRKVVVK